MQPQTGRTRLPFPLASGLSLFVIGGLLSVLAAYDYRLTFEWIGLLLVSTTIYCLIILGATTPQRLVQCTGILVLTATLLAGIALLQYRYLNWEAASGPIQAIGNATSAWMPPVAVLDFSQNVVAATIAGMLPAALGLVLHCRSVGRALWMCVSLVLLLGLVVCDSRGAWLALGISGIAALPILWYRHRPPMRLGIPRIIAAIAIMAVVAVSLVAWGLIQNSPHVHERIQSQSQLIRNSFFLAMDFLFTGIGGTPLFPMTYSLRQLLISVPYTNAPHNLILATWLAHGLLGLIGFLSMALVSVRLIMRSILNLTMPGLGAVLGSLALLIHGLLDAPQYDQWPAFVASIALLAIAMAATRLDNQQALRWISLSRRQRLGGSLIVAIVLVLALPNLLSRAVANYAAILHTHAALAGGNPATSQAETMQARAWAEYALRFDQTNPTAHKTRALIDYGIGRYAQVISTLDNGISSSTHDQAILKMLGYAYIWEGQPAHGIALLRQLDRASETYGELQVWQQAWLDRNRPDLAERAQEAQRLWKRKR